MLNPFDRLSPPDRTGIRLLPDVLEHLLDGVLILTTNGEVIYANQTARQISHTLNRGQPGAVPSPVWRLCQTLVESLSRYSNQQVTVESEIALTRDRLFRVRVRWLPLQATDRPYLVVVLEDCCQSLHSQAVLEIHQYGLTPRQAQVWLLHRLGYTYQEIAAKLYISLNTVKKHIKDIHLKRPVREAEE